MSAQVVVCCGSGGVGKTTVSAALALKWALGGAKVVGVYKKDIDKFHITATQMFQDSG